MQMGVPKRHFGSPRLQKAVDLIVMRLAQRHQMPDWLFTDPLVASMVQAVVDAVADQTFLRHAGQLPTDASILPMGGCEVFVVRDEAQPARRCSRVVVVAVLSTDIRVNSRLRRKSARMSRLSRTKHNVRRELFTGGMESFRRERDLSDELDEIREHPSDRPPEEALAFSERPGRIPTEPARGWRQRARKEEACGICDGDLWIEAEDGVNAG